MDWLVPFALTGCYEFYLHEVPWRMGGRGWRLAASCLLAAALWASYRVGTPIPWYWKFFLSYGVLFLWIWGTRTLRAAEGFYHTIILFLATDCILHGVSHMSMVLWSTDFLRDTSRPLPHLLFLAAVTALVLGVLYLVRMLVFREKRRLVSAAQVLLMGMTLLPILYLTNIHQWLGIQPSTVGLDASVVRIVLSLCGLGNVLGNEGIYRSRLMAQELKSMEAMLTNQSRQYLMKLESSEAIMQSCHDLKNQLYALRRSGVREEYMEQLQKLVDRYDSLYQTGNATLDIILSEKCLRCRESGIDLVCVVQGELLAFLNPIDLCTIFGNALDNAIEGLAGVEDRGKRIIQVKAAGERGFVVLRFENPYEHALDRTDNGFATTKPDSLGHGYGLKGISRAVDKYRGHMVIDTDNGRFALTLLFPLQSGGEN